MIIKCFWQSVIIFFQKSIFEENDWDVCRGDNGPCLTEHDLYPCTTAEKESDLNSVLISASTHITDPAISMFNVHSYSDLRTHHCLKVDLMLHQGFGDLSSLLKMDIIWKRKSPYKHSLNFFALSEKSIWATNVKNKHTFTSGFRLLTPTYLPGY